MAKKVTEKKVDLVACERELRKYIRRDGGYCKGISSKDRGRAKDLLKMLGRKNCEWDGKIIPVPQKSQLI